MDNPYRYSTPVQNRIHFFGRTSELTRIQSRIAADRPQSVSVVGPTGSGKSSLINFLLDPEVQADYLAAPSTYVLPRLRLQYHTPAGPAGFFTRLAAALAWVGEANMEPSYDGFGGLVRRLMSQGRRMVVCLDDFEAVTRNPGFPIDFYSFMRSVANSNDVGYLTTSAAPLQNLCHTQDVEESPFFNIFTTVNLEPLKEEAARQLVTEPAAAAGAPLDEEVPWILELAGRHPYLLQATASIAFEARAAGRTVDVRSLTSRAFEASRPYLECLWQELSDPQRQVLLAVSAHQPVARRHQYAVESLERRGYVSANGNGPVFAAGLVRLYAESQAPKKGFFRRLFGSA